ncbi:hypothetical protein [Peribacillus simplex]|uniref:hypothetical protein n=1 Tax=Peribacillus simplex TaxID=1478 RepID=UPI00366ADA13
MNLGDGELNNGVSGKMIRKGEYTIYNGKEYRFIESDTVGAIELITNVLLVTTNTELAKNGF